MSSQPGQLRLQIVPVEFAGIVHYVGQHHRHHKPPRGYKFGMAVADSAGTIRGVATVGRPVSRVLQDGWTLEVTRVATDGCPNACSALYAACWRTARALGYRRLITYTLQTEAGSSLRGAGWQLVGQRGGGTWHTPSRPRIDTAPTQGKLLWEVSCGVD